MEEEVDNYAVVFKSGAPQPKEKNEDPTIYSEVKRKQPATTVPNGEAAARSHARLWLLCSGVLCALLVAGIVTIIIFGVETKMQQRKLSHLMAENKQLMMEAEELNKDRDGLSWTLGVILKFNSFPVNQYCPDKKCQPCRQGWILFQEKCYLFYTEAPPWYTWESSRKYCKDRATDLVIIDDLQEQEFLSNHTEYYYSIYHGYWLGLKENHQTWVWTDGRNDTLKYWISGSLGVEGPCAMMIPQRNVKENWDAADCKMLNRFICEGDALIRPN